MPDPEIEVRHLDRHLSSGIETRKCRVLAHATIAALAGTRIRAATGSGVECGNGFQRDAA